MDAVGFPRRALVEHKGRRYEIRAELQGEGVVMVTILDENERPVRLPYEGAGRPVSVGVYSISYPVRPVAERAFSELVTALMAGAASDLRGLV